MSSLNKHWSHSAPVLNPELKIDFSVLETPELIQAACQTIDLDTWAAERPADEQTVFSILMNLS